MIVSIKQSSTSATYQFYIIELGSGMPAGSFGNWTAPRNCVTWSRRLKSLGSLAWRPRGAIQRPDQRPVACLLHLARRERIRCRDRGLSLGACMAKSLKRLSPIHPGEILRAEFMEPLKLSMNRLALDLHVPVTRVAEIVHERRGITPDTALRLARYFQTSARFWLNLQSAYDLEVAEDELSRNIEREVRPSSSVAVARS